MFTVVRETGAIPFDAKGVKLGHRDGKCSFEVIIEEYGLDIYYEEPSENSNPEKELKEYTERVYDTISRLDAPLEGTRYEFRIESKPGAPKVGKR